ncbi:Mitochondrial oxaloacetate transport protein [Elsinoe australis]|uniref:Mitochondrial oxaloacetate transport protein n=1 Tax=Elsinoe australis TaxID=40998 RepID=A0A2P7Z4H3_9PEZI|nr:Mitochondrial oxaloacetate transport protein [Elsinoe australis]
MSTTTGSFIAGGIAACGAVTVTHSFETVKIRLQLQGELQSKKDAPKLYRGVTHGMSVIFKNEGMKGLLRGINCAYAYQLLLNGCRLGFYDPIRTSVNSLVLHQSIFQKDEADSKALQSLPVNIFAGASSGILGAMAGSPFFLVKTRLQSYSPFLPVGTQHHYKGAWDGLTQIYKAEGVKGLYRGVVPAMIRTGFGSSVQLPTYFFAKRRLVKHLVKGAVHVDIFLPVLLHTLFAIAVVLFDVHHPATTLHLPQSLIPSLSIVVGLMLVFRNSTSYDRFWTGQQQLTTICTSIRNLSRMFLVSSNNIGKTGPSPSERADTETAVRLLLAYIYAVKSHLRQEWGLGLGQQHEQTQNLLQRLASNNAKLPPEPSFEDLLPSGVGSFEDHGLGLPVQIGILVEGYIQRGSARGWFSAPQASQLTVQLNTALSAFGTMETVRLTPIPVAYLIHIRQVLALFGAVLPFAMVQELGWWAVPLTTIIAFTLYGIEGIGQQLEDPFGYDKNDIKMDATVEDMRVEVMVLLDQWKSGGSMFRGLV